MQTHRLIAAATTLATALLVAPLLAGVDSSREVKTTVKATSKPDADGKQTIVVSLAINPGWHIYANPVNSDEFPGAETKVTVKGKSKLVKVAYPAGKVKVDVINKKEIKYNIYVDKVEIQAVVQRAPGATGPIEVNVTFMACDKENCLLPHTAKLKVD